MTLVQEPEILLIDELSLGLAPVVVQLLVVVEQLGWAEGQAMIIVEQLLNVALAFVDQPSSARRTGAARLSNSPELKGSPARSSLGRGRMIELLGVEISRRCSSAR